MLLVLAPTDCTSKVYPDYVVLSNWIEIQCLLNAYRMSFDTVACYIFYFKQKIFYVWFWISMKSSYSNCNLLLEKILFASFAAPSYNHLIFLWKTEFMFKIINYVSDISTWPAATSVLILKALSLKLNVDKKKPFIS